MLNLREDHKQHLTLLMKQPTIVLQDFCKLALEYLQKGPNIKLYISAGQKLNEDPQVIRNLVEGLVNLLLEGCKCKLKDEDFHNSLVILGFSKEHTDILNKLYISTKNELYKYLSATGLKLVEYHDMNWRFEVQVASRSVLQQTVPLITLDFALKNTNSPNEIEHITAQTDPNNLLHLMQELELAMQEGRGQHIRTVSRIIK